MPLDIDEIARQKIDLFQKKDPSLSFRYVPNRGEFGPWGVIQIMNKKEEIIGLEFVESRTSWRRPDAIESYSEPASRGICVIVLIPEAAFGGLAMELNSEGADPGIIVSILEEETSDKDLERIRTGIPHHYR